MVTPQLIGDQLYLILSQGAHCAISPRQMSRRPLKEGIQITRMATPQLVWLQTSTTFPKPEFLSKGPTSNGIT